MRIAEPCGRHPGYLIRILSISAEQPHPASSFSSPRPTHCKRHLLISSSSIHSLCWFLNFPLENFPLPGYAVWLGLSISVPCPLQLGCQTTHYINIGPVHYIQPPLPGGLPGSLHRPSPSSFECLQSYSSHCSN